MKAVMRQLAQARRHYSTLPLFEFLRDDSHSPRERGALVPDLAAYVGAYERFGAERGADVDRALRAFIVDVAVPRPLLAVRLAQIAYPATALQTRVIAASIDATGRVLVALAAELDARIDLGRARPRSDDADDVALEEIVLAPRTRTECLEAAFRVFDLFADWSNELHREVREAVGRRLTTPIVHSPIAPCRAN